MFWGGIRGCIWKGDIWGPNFWGDVWGSHVEYTNIQEVFFCKKG